MHKILIIEDDQILQKMYQNKFQNMDYTIVTASDGSEGYGQAKKEQPDLILLDLMMPKTDGINALKLLKGDEETRKIPVAVLSVIPQDDDMIASYPNLFDDIIAYWRKDQSDPSDIVEKVKKYLEAGK